MRQAPPLRKMLWIIVMGWAGTSGCIHNHYYGTLPAGCVPAGQPVTTQIGPVCEVPDGQVVVAGSTSPGTSSNVTPAPTRGTPVAVAGQPRVVISQPAYGPSIGQDLSRIKWRRPDPEAVATIKTEGGLDDTSIK